MDNETAKQIQGCGCLITLLGLGMTAFAFLLAVIGAG